jgi:hypothetical protein
VPSVTTRLKWLVGAFIAWTVFIWGNRISNAWSSATESTSAKVVSTLLAASFLAFALGAAVVLWRAWRRPLTDGARRFLAAFAGWTVLVWGVRIVGMALADHDLAFKVVHAVLGLVSIGLAVALVRSLRTTTTAHSFGEPGRVSTPT